MKKITISIILIHLVVSINAQNVEWKSIATEASSGQRITSDTENEYLQTRLKFTIASVDSYVAKLDKEGEQIWERKINEHGYRELHGVDVALSKYISKDSIIHILNDGHIYRSNSDGLDMQLIQKILPEFDQWSSFYFMDIEIVADQIMAIGAGELNGTYKILRAKVDLSTLEVTHKITDSEMQLSSSRVNSTTGKSIEIFNAYKTNEIETKKIVVNDFDFEPVLIIDSVFIDTGFIGTGYITENNNIILLGSSSIGINSSGIVIAYDLDGNLKWEHKVDPDEGEGLLGLREVQEQAGKLIVAGSTGLGFWILDILVLSLNEQDGEINWRLREHIDGESDEVTDLLILENGDIVISGTSGVTDYGGPERAFLLKISDVETSVSTLKQSDLSIYPNPSNSTISISTDIEIEQVDILNISGKLCKSVTGENTISVSNMASGIYLLRVKTKDRVLLKKVIVQN